MIWRIMLILGTLALIAYLTAEFVVGASQILNIF